MQHSNLRLLHIDLYDRVLFVAPSENGSPPAPDNQREVSPRFSLLRPSDGSSYSTVLTSIFCISIRQSRLCHFSTNLALRLYGLDSSARRHLTFPGPLLQSPKPTSFAERLPSMIHRPNHRFFVSNSAFPRTSVRINIIVNRHLFVSCHGLRNQPMRQAHSQ